MTITNGYCTLEVLKTRLGVTDTTDDTRLEQIAEAVSRAIDTYTGRHFYSASQTRYYTAERGHLLMVDDLLSVTTLATDDDGSRNYNTTWASGDYDLFPFNAQNESQARPYTQIHTTPAGTRSFPVGMAKGVKVVGAFGYASSTPRVIHEACLLMAQRIWLRKGTPFGVAGANGFGTLTLQMPNDPDIRNMLAPFVRGFVAGVG